MRLRAPPGTRILYLTVSLLINFISNLSNQYIKLYNAQTIHMINIKKSEKSTRSKKHKCDKDLNHYIRLQNKIITIMFTINVLSFLRLLVNYNTTTHEMKET